jgi:glutamine cyclotransferase
MNAIPQRISRLFPRLLLALACGVTLFCLWGPLSLNAAGPVLYTYRTVQQYPHDPTSFCQGLVVDDGRMIEGTGQYGQSQLKEVDLATGKAIQSIALAERYFGEGIAVVGDEVYQLTWREHDVLIFDKKTLQYKRMLRYNGEAWGLAYDGQYLILSDGTSILRWLDPATLKVLKQIQVRRQGRAVAQLNELEFINGEIFANVWHTDTIVRISPTTGEVVGVIDLAGLKPPKKFNIQREDVLNGIAWDAQQQKLYVTGKYWPHLYEIKIVKR